MEITLIALFVLLVLRIPAEGLEYTWVSNGSSKTTVVATTTYEYGRDHSGFINRVIAPGDYQSDQYLYNGNTIVLEIWVVDGCCHSILYLPQDESVVINDSPDPGVTLDGGVNVFQAVYGTLFHPEGRPLTTIYPGAGLCDPATWSCCSLGTPCS